MTLNTYRHPRTRWQRFQRWLVDWLGIGVSLSTIAIFIACFLGYIALPLLIALAIFKWVFL